MEGDLKISCGNLFHDRICTILLHIKVINCHLSFSPKSKNFLSLLFTYFTVLVLFWHCVLLQVEALAELNGLQCQKWLFINLRGVTPTSVITAQLSEKSHLFSLLQWVTGSFVPEVLTVLANQKCATDSFSRSSPADTPKSFPNSLSLHLLCTEPWTSLSKAVRPGWSSYCWPVSSSLAHRCEPRAQLEQTLLEDLRKKTFCPALLHLHSSLGHSSVPSSVPDMRLKMNGNLRELISSFKETLCFW